MINEFAVELKQVIPFGSLGKEKELSPGTIVTNVNPRALWTIQTWIETQKVQVALNRIIDQDDTFPTEGYIHTHRGKIILVLGDGNTKALIAWAMGRQVQFTIKGQLARGQKAIPLGRLRQQYHDLFREWEYK
jgi:hypothetical protein